MKSVLKFVLLLAGVVSVSAVPVDNPLDTDAAQSAQALATEPDCPRADRDICLANNLNPRCVNGVFQNDLPASCSRCFCTGCSGRCA